MEEYDEIVTAIPVFYNAKAEYNAPNPNSASDTVAMDEDTLSAPAPSEAEKQKNELFVIQFPYHDLSSSPLTQHDQLTVKHKIASRTSELLVPLDVNSVIYDTPKGALYGLSLNGGFINDGDPEDESAGPSMMNSVTMEGKQCLAGTSQSGTYFIASVYHGQLHLTPLDGVMRFQHSFSHVDKVDATEKTINEQDDDSENEVAKPESAAPKAKQVVQKKEQQSVENITGSYQMRMAVKRKVEEEAFVNYQLYKPKTEEDKQMLICKGMEEHVSLPVKGLEGYWDYVAQSEIVNR
jgi:hypothetical protein